MKPYVITIARQYGSGGKTVGKMLARKLGIPFYNREIITMASEDSGVNAMLFSDERLKGDFLTRLRAQITLEYDRGIPGQAQQAIAKLFADGPVLVKKRTKSGDETELDLKSMIFSLSMREASAQELELTVLVSAQNPSCNPQLLVNAIEHYLPEQKPDFARTRRLEIYDEQGNLFR